GVHGIADQPDPDKREAEQFLRPKGLVEDTYCQQQLETRRQVLQKANRCQAQAPGGLAETQQRHRSHHATEQQQSVELQVPPGQAGGTGRAQVDQVGHGRHQQEQCLHSQAEQTVHGRLLAQQPVKAEGQGQRQGQPGQFAQRNCPQENSRRRQGHAPPLQSPQSFTEKQQTQDDVDQGQDEVTQA